MFFFLDDLRLSNLPPPMAYVCSDNIVSDGWDALWELQYLMGTALLPAYFALHCLPVCLKMSKAFF